MLCDREHAEVAAKRHFFLDLRRQFGKSAAATVRGLIVRGLRDARPQVAQEGDAVLLGTNERWWSPPARLAIAVAIAVAVVVPVSATEPVREIDAATAVGCCVCRGNKTTGNVNEVRGCTDNQTAQSCAAICRGSEAKSLGFGYQQTCASGCAGFPTQGQ